jgi:V/A-type H+-transporting ATPase subunit I
MLLPQEMTSIELVVPEGDLVTATKILAGRGVFHQTETGYALPESKTENGPTWQEKAAGYAALERQILSTMQLLGVEERQAPETEDLPMVDMESVRPLIDRITQEAREIEEQLERDRKRLDRLNAYRRQLEPIAGIHFDIGILYKSRYIHSILGVIPAVNLERLKTSLRRIPFVAFPLAQDHNNAVVWLVCSKQNAETLDRAARSAYLNPMTLPPIHEGSPSKILDSLKIAIRREQQRLAERESALALQQRTHRQQLQSLLWRARGSRMLAEAMAHYGRLRYTYLVVGWVPTAAWPALQKRLREASKNILIESCRSPRAVAEPNIPVSLDHRGLLQPFQQLVMMFARPRYNELDPTLLMAVTFPVLFGAMFGDVGHGLELLLIGLLLRSGRVKALNSLAGLSGLITICGAAGCLFGFLYGSVFGLETVLPALWIRPIDNILQILYISVGAGIVLLSAGFLLNIVNAALARDWSRLLFDHNGLTGLILYWSLLGLAAGAFAGPLPIPAALIGAVAAVSGLAVMFSEILKRLVDGHRPLVEGGIGSYAIQTFFEMFDTLIAMLSNSLSYVRVGAFAVAHAGLSSVFFILAALLGPQGSALWWVVVLIGNLFIVGFEGLIVGIQTMRLEYYELFSKFFLGGGMRYAPLTLLPAAEEQRARAR